MRRLFLCYFSLVLAFSFLMSAERSVAAKQQSKYRLNKIEPETIYGQEGNGVSPIINYNMRNSLTSTLVDSSMNGYGLLYGSTFPLLKDENGWFATYRQWCGASCTSGQIGASYSANGTNWTQYFNVNGDMQVGRYPSSLGNSDYPFSFWNEYTGTGNPSYGGRPFYSFDEFGWDGGSFSNPADVDLLWFPTKDLWAGSPALSYDDGLSMFNVVYADWTRSDVYLFHSEAYEDGYVIFGEEIKVIDETTHLVGGDDEGSYTSSPVLDVNADGVGYTAVTAYWSGADVGAGTYGNTHTAIFAKTTDHGATWSGGTGEAPYYFVPDDVYAHMIESGAFPDYWEDPDACSSPPESYTFTELFCAYDFHLRVDSNGNPHFILGILPGGDGYVYPSIGSGFVHLWIDHNHLENPGDPQSETGWNYSVVASLEETWPWDLGGWSAWQFFFPHLAISEENEDVMYVVSSMVTQGEETDPDDDPCTYDSYFEDWSIDLYVMKSEDGGETWWCPYRATETNPTADNDGFCSDGLTQDTFDEHAGHTGSGATNSVVPVLYNYSDYCYGSTTGDAAPPDYKQRLYIGEVSLDSEPQCGDCPCAGDSNGDSSVDVLDIISIVNYLLGAPPVNYFECAADQNGDGSMDVLDIISIVNCLLAGGCDCSGNIPRESSLDINNATSININKNNNAVNINGNGFIGGIQMLIKHDNGFELELSDDYSFDEVGFGAFNTNGNTTTIIVVAPSNGNLFTANKDFKIIDVVAASGDGYLNINIIDQFALLDNYPNPFNPETTITYELFSNGAVELSIYNVSGQLVNTLIDKNLEAGLYNTIWNGFDQNGSAVASGIYFMQLRTDNDFISRKITLLR